MTTEQFCYWLQGYFEINDVSPDKIDYLSHTQVQVIKDHLKLVFNKATPDRLEEQQDCLFPKSFFTEPINPPVGTFCSDHKLSELNVSWKHGASC